VTRHTIPTDIRQTDLEIRTDAELMVAHVEGQNVSGDAFVNNYLVDPMVVLDANRIIIHSDALPDLVRAAADVGLDVEVIDVTKGAVT
jgi:hypothetical protein